MHESSKRVQECLADMYDDNWYDKDDVDSTVEVSIDGAHSSSVCVRVCVCMSFKHVSNMSCNFLCFFSSLFLFIYYGTVLFNSVCIFHYVVHFPVYVEQTQRCLPVNMCNV